jgi:altronate dehydratase small subunit
MREASPAFRLAPGDNVAVARRPIAAGETFTLDGATVTAALAIPVGHKLAAQPIAAGETILKYGCPIGRATAAIAPGDYVHVHNVASDYLPTYTLPEG